VTQFSVLKVRDSRDDLAELDERGIGFPVIVGLAGSGGAGEH